MRDSRKKTFEETEDVRVRLSKRAALRAAHPFQCLGQGSPRPNLRRVPGSLLSNQALLLGLSSAGLVQP